MVMSSPVSDARAARLHRALDEARQLLIEHIDCTVSELQSALAYVATSRAPLDNQLAESAWQELTSSGVEVHVRVATVMAVTAEYFELTTDEFRATRGANPVARARQIAMYLCRELTDLSLPRIGREFDRDHTTVMHAVRKIRQQVVDGGRVAGQVRDLTMLIKKRAAMTTTRGLRQDAHLA